LYITSPRRAQPGSALGQTLILDEIHPSLKTSAAPVAAIDAAALADRRSTHWFERDAKARSMKWPDYLRFRTKQIRPDSTPPVPSSMSAKRQMELRIEVPDEGVRGIDHTPGYLGGGLRKTRRNRSERTARR
jgi:hypothetical protein